MTGANRLGGPRPWWAWGCSLGVGLGVTAVAPFYWVWAGAVAAPDAAARSWKSLARGWWVTRLWLGERWRSRHRALRRVREAGKWTGRHGQRLVKRVRRVPAMVSRTIGRDLPRQACRLFRRIARVVRPWGGRVRRIMRRS